MAGDEIKRTVMEEYGQAALRVAGGERGSCGGTGSCGCDPVSSNLYDAADTATLPEGAVLASLGCGNPTALAELHQGEIVLDLGSGGGIDVLLSARRVGPTGKAYGLDMTDEMLALARENQRRAGVTNVEFLRGEIENIPLPDASVDVIISNCVINLSADKRKVLAEASRVLKPGGRFAVSDVVVRGEIPDAVRRSMELWVGWRAADRVNPHAVETLREYNVPWSGRTPRSIDGLEREPWDFVVTVCDRAKEACPIFPGQPILAHWGMPDPAEAAGDDVTKRAAFKDAFLLLSRRIDLLLALPLETLERLALEARVRAIGNG